MNKKAIITTLIAILLFTISPLQALEDGAYVTTCSTSYVNPLTGKSEDGGTNIELGDSMIASLVESQVLIERVDGNTYVTIGLGLASNISNVRFKSMNDSMVFSNLTATITGTSSANGDSVNHYRFKIDNLSNYISPIIYVEPMARDVQFFIKVNETNLTSGTGIYNSLLVTTNKEETVEKKEETTIIETPPTTTSEEVTRDKITTITEEELFKDIKALTINKINKTDEKNNNYLSIILSLFVVLIIILGGLFYVKKIKK